MLEAYIGYLDCTEPAASVERHFRPIFHELAAAVMDNSAPRRNEVDEDRMPAASTDPVVSTVDSANDSEAVSQRRLEAELPSSCPTSLPVPIPSLTFSVQHRPSFRPHSLRQSRLLLTRHPLQSRSCRLLLQAPSPQNHACPRDRLHVYRLQHLNEIKPPVESRKFFLKPSLRSPSRTFLPSRGLL